MRIVLDIQSCQSGSRFGGIGRYSLELAKAMVRLAPEDEFLIVLNDRNPGAIHRIRQEFRDLLPPDNFRVFAVPDQCFYLPDGGKVALVAEFIREQFLLDLKPDFIHLTSLFEGFLDKVVTSVDISGAAIPTAVTLYDLIPIAQKELYLADARAREHYFSKFDQLKKAHALLAISDFSAREGVELIGDYKGVVADIRGGIDASFRPMPDAKARIGDFLERRGIGDKFLMYTASFDQRKNQRKLIEAFAALPAAVRKGYQVVIVGDGWPAVYHELRVVASDLGLTEKEVIFTGRVSDEELVGLYTLCTLFVFPSLWEGLGMPVLEAMACGAPVIGSNSTSVPEVLGLAEAEFDPTDVRSIAAKMEQALTNKKFYAALKAHAARHVAGFTWEESARRALAAIRQAHVQLCEQPRPRKAVSPRAKLAALVSKGDYSEEQVWEIACCLAANELEAGAADAPKPKIKLGWVTSWATRCGIASYSDNLLQGLDADVAILAPEAPGVTLNDTPNVTRCWAQGKEGKLDELAARIDALELTDIVVQFNFGFFNFENFNAFIEEQVVKGRRVYITLHSTHDTMDLQGHRLVDLYRGLAAANAVIVHADQDIERLAAMGISQNVVQIPQGVRLYGGGTVPRKDGAEVIASYGFFLPNKGLPELIEALSIVRQSGRDVKLKMVNAHYGDSSGYSDGEIAKAKAKAEALGIGDHVTMITDYLPETESIDHLRGADLIVYAYQNTGESSSAAVRTGLASGTPIAVTPLRIFDDVAEATFRLPGVAPDQMAAGVIATLDKIKAGDDSVARRKAAAGAWCASHDVAAVRDRLMRLVRKEAATEVWQSVIAPKAVELPRAEGVAEKDLLHSARMEGGLLCYGPYIDLVGGLYRFVAYGKASAGPNGQMGSVNVTAEAGGRVLSTFDIKPTAPGVLIDCLLHLDRPASGVEFGLSYAPGARMELSHYTVAIRVASA